MTIYACRSTKEIHEDALVSLHTEVEKSLNLMCSGKCLYTGRRRERLLAFKDKVEQAILGEDKPLHSLPYSSVLAHEYSLILGD